MVVVTSNTKGETKIMLTTPPPSSSADEDYAPEVETDRVIDGWPGQTLKRGGNDELATPQDATFYTNIEKATEMKLMYTGDDVPMLARLPVRVGCKPSYRCRIN